MGLESLLKVETVVLVVIVALFVVVIVKMKPLKDFSNIKIGKGGVELNRSDEYKKLLDFAEGFTASQKTLEGRITEIDDVLKYHYRFIRNAVVQSGIGVAWSDKGAPFDETVRALLMNISLGENGNHENRLVEVVMGKGKGGVEDYRSKLNEFIKENKDRLDGRFYEAVERVGKRLA